jgi:hypothetical protein
MDIMDIKKCMFLRECKCLRIGPGHCNRCGKDTQYSSQEKCWYCDCQCNTKNCSMDRNPDKKYFAIKDTKVLFDEFKNLKEDVQNLAGIVQNDMLIDMEQLKEWLQLVSKFQKSFSVLVKTVTSEILKKQV